MRVLCCGDRHWTDEVKIEQRLRELQQAFPRLLVVEGEAPGADRLSRQAAERLGIPVEPHPANWARYGKAAGPIRNQEQLDSGVDLVLAFHANVAKSRGTKDMVARARRAGIPVEVIR